MSHAVNKTDAEWRAELAPDQYAVLRQAATERPWTGELLDVCRGLRVIAYEDGFLTGPDRFVQRIAAVREGAGGGPRRHAL